MNRQIFRSWGAGLPDVQFARALAAAGVLNAYRPDPSAPAAPKDMSRFAALLYEAAAVNDSDRERFWLKWAFPESSLRSWEFPESTLHPADVFARAWEEAGIPGQGLRLEVAWPSDDSAEDVVSELSRAEVGLGSVYHRVDEPAGATRWQWPLRIGLLDDARSHALRRAIEDARSEIDWLERLVTVDSRPGRVDCDLFLLPMDLRTALIAVLELRQRPQAGCTIVLGRNTGSARHRGDLLRTMRSSVRTAGTVLTHVSRDRQRNWFVELIHDLSHAQTIDLALFTAARSVEGRPPYIAASRKLVELSDLAVQVRRMGERFASRAMRHASIDVEPDSAIARNLPLPPGRHSLEEVGASLKYVSRDRGYLSETGMASAAVELAGAAADIESAEQATPRWIQARVLSAGEKALLETVPVFLPGAVHRIDVHIGPRTDGWLAPATADVFPSDLLPETGRTHTLSVLLSEPQLMEQPQLATIELPLAGASTTCSFDVVVPHTVRDVAARIVVVYDNRVLQTALLRGGVGRKGAESPITLDVEAVVRSALYDLDERSRFDGALVLNHDSRGTPRITALADDDFRSFPVSKELGREIEWFDDRLTQVAYDRGLFDGLDKPDTVDLLRDFARHGRNLYGHIVSDQIGSAGLARGDRIHVVSLVPEDRLPVEFIYDRPTPGPNAELCPHAMSALRNGECDAACAHDIADPCICPLGFWGLRKIIERHAHDPALTARVGALPFGFAAEPLRPRRELKPLSCGMVVGTQRVDTTVPGGYDRICTRLAAVTSKHTTPVRSLEHWRDHVTQRQPSIEILIVHTEPVSSTDNMARMEVGAGDWLAQIDLDERYVTAARDTHSPVVVLLGCETAAPEVDFAGFIVACRRGGASIVVAAGAKIHSEHAVRVAEAFIDALNRAIERGPVTFGEVMRSVRRDLLADGLPMVLTLSAYGDADWNLTC